MNIVLIGYRGAGKSAVGKEVASHLQMRFVDTDDLIEELQGVSISDMVQSHGWSHFRALEKELIAKISKEDHSVIAPGGGAVLDAENVTALRKNGLIVWLKADLQQTLRRMKQDSLTAIRRPSLTGRGTMEELEEMISAREPFYEKASDIQFDTSGLDIEAAVQNLLSILRKKVERI